MVPPDLEPHGRRTTALARKRNGPPPARRPAPPAEPSTASLVKDAFTDALGVLEAHVELAVLEVREDAQVAVQVAATFGVGAALTLLAVGFLLAAAALGLALVLPAWLACLLVGAVASVAALVALLAARHRFKNHDFRPERSIEVAQEKREWRAEKTS
jgi:uncharacterized membrane protein YqjE